jgi:hypothetical protein
MILFLRERFSQLPCGRCSAPDLPGPFSIGWFEIGDDKGGVFGAEGKSGSSRVWVRDIDRHALHVADDPS